MLKYHRSLYHSLVHNGKKAQVKIKRDRGEKNGEQK